jgi:hypothetical protein
LKSASVGREPVGNSDDRHSPASENENGAPEEIRTPDPQIRSLVLYPAELRALCASRGKVLPLTRLAARAIAIGSAC